MTEPNPFSTANSLNHLVNPKIVTGATGYEVKVDIANVDTFYGNSVGASGLRIPDIWVNRIHAVTYDPLPAGVTGPQGPPAVILGGTGISAINVGGTYTISSLVNVVGSSTVNVTTTGSTFTLSSPITVQGSQYISVSAGPTFTVTYTGSQGGGGGAAATTGQTGPQGQIVYYTPGGLTSSSDFLYDTTGRILNVPEINIETSTLNGGVMDLSTFQGDAYIQSGLFVPSSGQQGNYFYISPFGQTAQSALAIDTQNYRVGINTDTPKTYLDVQGQTEITYDASFGDFPLLAGGTGSSGSLTINPGSYTINAWGSGGASNGGVGGGGGASVTQIVVGATGTLTWGPQGGNSGGGPATQIAYNGATFLWVPGGGAGGTGGTGGAAGRSGLPYPEGGDGGSGGVATLTDTQDWRYTLANTVGTSGGTFSSGSIGSVNAVGSAGTVITFSQAGSQSTNGLINTYTFTGPTTFTISNSSMSFAASTFSTTASSFNAGIITGINSGDGTGTSGVTMGTALFDPFIPGSSTPGTATGSNVTLNGTATVSTGNVTWIGGTYTSPSLNGYTLILNGSFSDIVSAPNRTLTITGPTQITFGSPLGQFNGVFNTDGTVTVPGGSLVPVTQRTFINRGQAGSFQTSGLFGGGGFTGGGTPAKVTGVVGYTGSYDIPGNMFAGGGPGTWGVSGVSGISIGGNESYIGTGRFPFQSKFNAGIYGIGGVTGPGTSGYLAIENNNVPFTEPALIVNGNTTINGVLTVDSGITIKGPTNSSSFLTSTITGGGGWRLNVRNGLNVTEGLNGAEASFSGLLTASAGITTTTGTFSGLITGTTGTFSGNVTALDLIASSDRRLKQNIVTIDSALEKVLKLRGVYFNRLNSEKRNLGVIAQEVEDVLPEVVFTDETSEQMKSVAYGNIVALLIEALKEQQEQIDKLM
jgi:hypothetical protein